MQYLQQNKVNYYNSDSNIIFSNGVESLNSDQAYIVYSDYNNNSNYNSSFDQGTYNTQKNTTSFTIYSANTPRYTNKIMFIIRPSFTCSDITTITGNITFRVSYTTTDTADTIAKEYIFPLKKQFMNTYNLYDILQVNDTVNSFTISATSDINLTLLQPKTIVDDNNRFANVSVVYL